MEIGSGVMKQLATNVPPANVEYRLIAGDIEQLREKGFNGEDEFLTKLLVSLKRNVIHPVLTAYVFKNKPHDGVVTQQSMITIPGFIPEKQMVDVVSDHLGYFREYRCQQELAAWLNLQIPL